MTTQPTDEAYAGDVTHTLTEKLHGNLLGSSVVTWQAAEVDGTRVIQKVGVITGLVNEGGVDKTTVEVTLNGVELNVNNAGRYEQFWDVDGLTWPLPRNQAKLFLLHADPNFVA